VIGEAANLATRLLDRAGANEILASAEIGQANARFADYEGLGDHSLQGVDEPVPVYRLKGLREPVAESRASPLTISNTDSCADQAKLNGFYIELRDVKRDRDGFRLDRAGLMGRRNANGSGRDTAFIWRQLRGRAKNNGSECDPNER
jgi:hypothetical protein